MFIKKTKVFNFINKVYHINQEMGRLLRKNYKRVKIKASTVGKTLIMGMLMREKSINQIMEKIHKRSKYKKIYKKGEKIPKTHGFREGIKKLIPKQLKKINIRIVKKSRENKIYRQGTIDGLVVAGIDGVETFGSYKKDWGSSYKTKIKVKKYNEGKEQIEEREYHKQINLVAKIVGKRPGLVLDYEKITDKGKNGKQQYEPDVGIELLTRIRKEYGRMIDIIVGDAIYLNKKFIQKLLKLDYHCILRLKGNNANIIENAEGIFKGEKQEEWKDKRKVVNTNIHQERKIKAWSDIFEYEGIKIRVVKFEETYNKTKKERQVDIIYVISTDLNISVKTINKIIHARWDIENDGFNELKNYWNMKHCFIAEENAIDVIIETIIMSYNLWEMYLYQHLHDFEGMKMTKIGYIEEVRERLEKLSKEEIGFSSA